MNKNKFNIPLYNGALLFYLDNGNFIHQYKIRYTDNIFKDRRINYRYFGIKLVINE